MADACIVNASPLIFLAKADRLQWLRLGGEPVLIPASVASEVEAHGDDIAARAMRGLPWLQRLPPISVPATVIAWDLGAGEASVLAHCLAAPGATAVLDDLAARRCAAALGVPVRGCVGLVLRAKRLGQVRLARPELELLRDAGLFLSDRVLQEALSLVGE